MTNLRQNSYARFFIEDAIRYFLYEEGISWIPPRPLVIQEMYLRMNDVWKFAENFAIAMKQAKVRFRSALISEVSGIMHAVRHSEGTMDITHLRSTILSLARRLSYNTYDGFYAFLSAVIDLCIRFFKEGQTEYMYVTMGAAVWCMFELAPDNINLMFHILHRFSTRFLASCTMRDLYPQLSRAE